jgi:hypothetical protein
MVGEVSGSTDDGDQADNANAAETPKTAQREYSLFTHRHFDFAFNGNRIIEVMIRSSLRIPSVSVAE